MDAGLLYHIENYELDRVDTKGLLLYAEACDKAKAVCQDTALMHRLNAALARITAELKQHNTRMSYENRAMDGVRHERGPIVSSHGAADTP